jgi:hypothetical protein
MNRRWAVGLTLFLALAATSLRANDTPGAPKPAAFSPEQIREVGRDAYIWGWPLVYLHQCRDAVRYVKVPGRAGGAPVAPLNQLAMMTDYIAPTAKAAPCPNQDVVYGFGMLDLGKEPLILQVPDFGDRFWLFQLGDQRTDRFAKLGKMHGSKPGFYMIAGPHWTGEKPDGIVEVLRCPTRIGYCIPRVFQHNSDEDHEAIQDVLSQISLYPMSKFDGEVKTRDWTKSRWYPNLGQVPGQRGKRFAPEGFLDALAEVLEEAPPLVGEEKLYRDFRSLLAQAAGDPASKAHLLKSFEETESDVMTQLFEFHNIGARLPHGWTTLENGGEFGLDYTTRAAVARSNIFVNANEESKYYYQDFDDEGERLIGSHQYKITFAAGKLPPTKGFWSVTLYDAEHSLYENDARRYAVGAKDDNLRYNADGSLTIYVQHAPPPAGWETNWLPAPQQEFSLYLRAYWPDAAILSGNWTPPAVIQDRPVAERIASQVVTQPSPSTTAAPAPPSAKAQTAANQVSARRFAIRRSHRAGRR